MPEPLPGCRAEHLGRLAVLFGDHLEARQQDHHHQRRRAPGLGDGDGQKDAQRVLVAEERVASTGPSPGADRAGSAPGRRPVARRSQRVRRLLDLAWPITRRIWWPTASLGVVEDALEDLRLVVEHGLNRLALEDDPAERVEEDLVQLAVLRAQPDRQE